MSVGSEPWYQDSSSAPTDEYNLAWGGQLLVDEPSGINADPLFTDPTGADGDRDDDFQLGDPSSPAIDAGDPAVTSRSDILGNPIQNGRMDIGAFEFTGG